MKARDEARVLWLLYRQLSSYPFQQAGLPLLSVARPLGSSLGSATATVYCLSYTAYAEYSTVLSIYRRSINI